MTTASMPSASTASAARSGLCSPASSRSPWSAAKARSGEPVLYGAPSRACARAVRLALAERCVACRLEEVAVFGPEGVPAAHRARPPFGRTPAFEHDGFRLYESGAISRYVDEAFAG